MTDHRCARCGTTLKTETVQVPVYLDLDTSETPATGKVERVLARYEDHEEVSDCPRCQGAY